eukprot:5886989-Amphidinium_carterae.2
MRGQGGDDGVPSIVLERLNSSIGQFGLLAAVLAELGQASQFASSQPGLRPLPSCTRNGNAIQNASQDELALALGATQQTPK